MPSTQDSWHPASPAVSTQGPTIGDLTRSFVLHLRALNSAARTIDTYCEGLRSFTRFLTARNMPQAVGSISREHVREWLVDQQMRGLTPGTQATRLGAVQAFYKWALDEGEVTKSPVARMPRPRPGEKAPVLPTMAQLARLMKLCEGKGFIDRRDLAMLLMLLDTGMRRFEIAGLRLADVDWERARILVRAKGSQRRTRERWAHLGHRALRALDAYLRIRARHRYSDRPELWLGMQGPLGSAALYDRVKLRVAAAGIGWMHPHSFRHTFAHLFLEAGGQEGDLRELGGWNSDILWLYGKAQRSDRAMLAHERLSPGDRI